MQNNLKEIQEFVREEVKRVKIKLFGCKHIWINEKQENTSNLMVAPSPFIADFHTLKRQIEEEIKRKCYLGTTIVDKCAECGVIRSEQTEDRIKQTALEIRMKGERYIKGLEYKPTNTAESVENN